MKGKATEMLDDLVKKIDGTQTSGFIRHSLFSDGAAIPCRRWSLLNRFVAFVSGTSDARGIRQWNDAGRSVKKRARPFYILVPMFRPKTNSLENVGDGNGTEEGKSEPSKELTGFRLMPVFRVEDTDGRPLDYEEKLKAFDVKKLPLIDVARKLGVTVRAGLTFDGIAGSFNPGGKRITMGTSAPSVFLHELSHAVDFALPGRKDDYAFGEVVAELSAAFLGSLYGVQIDIPGTKAYIESWAGKGHVAFRLADAMRRVEEIYRFIDANRTKRRRKSHTTEGGAVLLRTRRAVSKTVFDWG